MLKNCVYDWIIDLKLEDKRVLNMIHSKIQYRHTCKGYDRQDAKVRDPINTIEGDMKVSVCAFQGLLMPNEDTSKTLIHGSRVSSYIELKLENSEGQALKTFKTPPVKDSREAVFGEEGGLPEQTFSLDK